jgi:hypothetical protein
MDQSLVGYISVGQERERERIAVTSLRVNLAVISLTFNTFLSDMLVLLALQAISKSTGINN